MADVNEYGGLVETLKATPWPGILLPERPIFRKVHGGLLHKALLGFYKTDGVLEGFEVNANRGQTVVSPGTVLYNGVFVRLEQQQTFANPNPAQTRLITVKVDETTNEVSLALRGVRDEDGFHVARMGSDGIHDLTVKALGRIGEGGENGLRVTDQPIDQYSGHQRRDRGTSKIRRRRFC